MKTLSLKIKPKTVVLVLLMTTVLAVGTWVTWLWISLPHDIVRKNLTIEEAQSLVSFPVCAPTYKPPEINSDPQIIYDADAANVPQETYIRLRYQRADNYETMFEIYQRYTQDSGMKTAYPEAAHGGAKVNLLDWISYPKFLSESEMEVAMTRAQMISSVFESNGIVWWLYEITEPIEYRSTMTKWIKDHVEYRILSLLTAEEIKKVTLSMLDCSNP
jgi:hypothetical protein